MHACMSVRTDGSVRCEVDEAPVTRACMRGASTLTRGRDVHDVAGLEVAVYQPQAVQRADHPRDVKQHLRHSQTRCASPI